MTGRNLLKGLEFAGKVLKGIIIVGGAIGGVKALSNSNFSESIDITDNSANVAASNNLYSNTAYSKK